MSKPATILNGEILLNVVAAGGTSSHPIVADEGAADDPRHLLLCSRWANLRWANLRWAYCTGRLALGVLHWIYRTGPA